MSLRLVGAQSLLDHGPIFINRDMRLPFSPVREQYSLHLCLSAFPLTAILCVWFALICLNVIVINFILYFISRTLPWKGHWQLKVWFRLINKSDEAKRGSWTEHIKSHLGSNTSPVAICSAAVMCSIDRIKVTMDAVPTLSFCVFFLKKQHALLPFQRASALYSTHYSLIQNLWHFQAFKARSQICG